METRLTGLERIDDITRDVRGGRTAALVSLVMVEATIAILSLVARQHTHGPVLAVSVQGTLIFGVPLFFVVHTFGRAPTVFEIGVGAGVGGLAVLVFTVVGWYVVLLSLLFNPALALGEVVFLGMQVWLFTAAVRVYRTLRSRRTAMPFALGVVTPCLYFILLVLAENALRK
ncbi:MAG: hypothetical protein ABJD07_01625 [Gemmatimonadaceae bacterium]